jgi:hypothetical protein
VGLLVVHKRRRRDMDLEKYRVGKLPDTVYYIPNILSSSEEALLMDKIEKSPKTKWTQLRNRFQKCLLSTRIINYMHSKMSQCSVIKF